MLFPLIFLFTVVPLVELYLLIQVGSVIGTMNTLALVIFTGVAGAYLARSQGRSIMMKVQTELARGGLPADSLIHGLMVFIGGILLVTPGIVTDIVGFCFVIPVTRWVFIKIIKAHFKKAISQGRYKFHNVNMSNTSQGMGGFHVYTHTTHSQGFPGGGTRDVVEVSAETLDSGKGQSDSSN